MLRCAYDNCAVTAEFKKQKYTYYRCTGYRGKCDLPYFREEVMADRLGQVLQAIRIPDDVLAQLEESLLSDKAHEETLRKRQADRMHQRLIQLRRRLEEAYVVNTEPHAVFTPTSRRCVHPTLEPTTL